MILSKGRVRYTGPTAGQIDPRLARAVEDVADEEEDDSSMSEYEGEYDEAGDGYGRGYGMWDGWRGGGKWMGDAERARYVPISLLTIDSDLLGCFKVRMESSSSRTPW